MNRINVFLWSDAAHYWEEHGGGYRQLTPQGLIHAVTYNNRLQPNEIKFGTSGAPTSIVDPTYSYGTTTTMATCRALVYSGEA
jgi:hypothetical protein